MACDDASYLNSNTSPTIPPAPKERVVRLQLRKGEGTSRHSHPSDLMVIGLRGVWRFYLDDRTVILGEDQVLRLPAGVEHRAEALTDGVALNISPSSEADCCSAFLLPHLGPVIPNDSLQDPDQYLWGV